MSGEESAVWEDRFSTCSYPQEQRATVIQLETGVNPNPSKPNFGKYLVLSCLQAYKQGIYGSSHVWILAGPSMYDNWIKNAKMEDLDCTKDQVIEASNGHFTLDYRKISKSSQVTIAGKVIVYVSDSGQSCEELVHPENYGQEIHTL